MLNKEQRITAFVELGHFLQKSIQQYLTQPDSIPAFKGLLTDAFSFNGWFDEVNVLRSFSGIIELLAEKGLRQITNAMPENNTHPKSVALIMAGNIPMVGFHDMLMVLLSGHQLVAKLSSDDKILPAFLMDALITIQPEFKSSISFAEGKLTNIEAVIATGSNNSARYFDYYFGKYPNIIRKNRQSVAILKGNETTEQLQLLNCWCLKAIISITFLKAYLFLAM
jgi:Acyl-CoA reductase (LuxC)